MNAAEWLYVVLLGVGAAVWTAAWLWPYRRKD